MMVLLRESNLKLEKTGRTREEVKRDALYHRDIPSEPKEPTWQEEVFREATDEELEKYWQLLHPWQRFTEAHASEPGGGDATFNLKSLLLVAELNIEKLNKGEKQWNELSYLYFAAAAEAYEHYGEYDNQKEALFAAEDFLMDRNEAIHAGLVPNTTRLGFWLREYSEFVGSIQNKVYKEAHDIRKYGTKPEREKRRADRKARAKAALAPLAIVLGFSFGLSFIFTGTWHAGAIGVGVGAGVGAIVVAIPLVLLLVLFFINWWEYPVPFTYVKKVP